MAPSAYRRSKKSRAIAGEGASARGSNGIWPRASWLRTDPTQLAEFIYSEYCLRVELQETPSPEEYYRHFPTVTEPLRRLFESRKQNPAKAASVPPSPPEFDSLEENPGESRQWNGTEDAGRPHAAATNAP